MTNSPSNAIDPTALAILAATPDLVRTLLGGLAGDVLIVSRDDGWSVRDAFAHMVDVEVGVISVRVRRILEEGRPFIRSIDAPARLKEFGYDQRTVPPLLDELTERREHVAWLGTLDAAQVGRVGEHDEAGEITAGDVVHQWAYHDIMHLKQMGSMLQASLLDRMGNTPRFYDV